MLGSTPAWTRALPPAPADVGGASGAAGGAVDAVVGDAVDAVVGAVVARVVVGTGGVAVVGSVGAAGIDAVVGGAAVIGGRVPMTPVGPPVGTVGTVPSADGVTASSFLL